MQPVERAIQTTTTTTTTAEKGKQRGGAASFPCKLKNTLFHFQLTDCLLACLLYTTLLFTAYSMASLKVAPLPLSHQCAVSETKKHTKRWKETQERGVNGIYVWRCSHVTRIQTKGARRGCLSQSSFG